MPIFRRKDEQYMTFDAVRDFPPEQERKRACKLTFSCFLIVCILSVKNSLETLSNLLSRLIDLLILPVETRMLLILVIFLHSPEVIIFLACEL